MTTTQYNLLAVILLQYRKLCYSNGLNCKRRASTSTLFTQTIIIPKAQTDQTKVFNHTALSRKTNLDLVS